MGYATAKSGVKSFWPDETDTHMYVPFGEDLATLIDMCRVKWGENIRLDSIMIAPVYIQTEHIGYDIHDVADFTCFLEITKA